MKKILFLIVLILLIPHPCYGTETILNDQLEALNLGTFIQEGEKYTKEAVKPMSSRPCVEIYAGYFDYFEKDRIQVIGSKELAIFELLDNNVKRERLEQLFSYNSPAFVFTKNAEVPKVVVEVAIEKQMPILKSDLTTSALIGNLHAYLSTRLAERISIDGAMLDVYGVGVLITGREGIGKSETALELIKHGHLLISGEETHLYQREPGMLIAETTEVMEKLMDIKDIGMVNVVNLFGIGAFRSSKRLRMVIELVTSDEEIKKDEKIKFFDTEIPHMTIVVEKGRNIASLIETAALNQQLLLNGLSGEKEYAKRKANDVIGRRK